MKGKPLHRREVVARLLEKRGDLLVIGGLAALADIISAGDRDLNFPYWGGCRWCCRRARDRSSRTASASLCSGATRRTMPGVAQRVFP